MSELLEALNPFANRPAGGLYGKEALAHLRKHGWVHVGCARCERVIRITDEAVLDYQQECGMQCKAHRR